MAQVIGQSVKRMEDRPHLVGQGAYSDDIQIAGTQWAHFVRSPHAHARIRSIDTSAAVAHPGVTAVLTGRDVFPRYNSYPLVAIPGIQVLAPYASNRPPYYLMAVDKVKYMGEIVAMVVARERLESRDAEELVRVDYEILPSVGEPEDAMRADAPSVHDGFANEALAWSRATDNVNQAFEEAEVIVRQRFVNQRIHGTPMEPRAGIAEWDRRTNRLTMHASTQTPHDLKEQTSSVLNLHEDQVRVVAPHVGGGFGPKAHGDPEYVLLAAASIEVDAPVKWVSTRSEEFLGMSHARGKISHVELASTREGRVTGMRVRHYADLGAYPKGPETTLSMGSVMSCVGAYQIPEVDLEVHAVYTHRTPEAPYRGAGRPEGIFLIERAMDILARDLNMDPAEIRRRNFIPAESFPYTTPSGDVYDSGDYRAALEKALEVSGYSGLRDEQTRLRQEGRYLGVGICSWLKSGGIGPGATDPNSSAWEWGRVLVDRNGSVTVFTGSSPHGQGLETTFAQVAAEVLEIPVESIRVVAGDTSLVAHGIGTFASRSMAVGGPAIHNAAHKIRSKLVRIAAHRLGVSPEQVVYGGGNCSVQGKPESRMTMAEAISAAHRMGMRPTEEEYGLDENSFFQPTGVTFSSGTYVTVVEVDVDTGDVNIRDLFCVDDQGVVVNPQIVEAQIHGGAVQGLGQAMCEQIVYDEAGQLTTGTFLDYGLPTAEMVPSFVTETMVTPTHLNPLGVKGMGEGPTVGMPPALVNAVVDALEPLGVMHIEMPLTPDRVRRAIEQAQG